MTAPATTDARPATPPGGIVQHVDLYYPGQQDPIGTPIGVAAGNRPPVASDRLLYVVWIKPRPVLHPGEWAPRLALHVNHPSPFLEVRRAPHRP